jgi:RibD C-terminal domain
VAITGGGTLLRQVITLGLLDELELHIVPVILGNGMRLLGLESGLDNMEGIELTPARVIAAPDVTHIRYTVNGRRPLVFDNRGRDEEPAPAQQGRATAVPMAAAYDDAQRPRSAPQRRQAPPPSPGGR